MANQPDIVVFNKLQKKLMVIYVAIPNYTKTGKKKHETFEIQRTERESWKVVGSEGNSGTSDNQTLWDRDVTHKLGEWAPTALNTHAPKSLVEDLSWTGGHPHEHTWHL